MYRESSVILSEDEHAAWKESRLSLTDLIEDGVSAAEADPGVLAAGTHRRNMAATGRPGVKVPLRMHRDLAARLDAVKAAAGVGTPAVIAAGLKAAKASRGDEAVLRRVLDEKLAPLLERLEALEEAVALLAGASGNGGKAAPGVVPFRAAGQ